TRAAHNCPRALAITYRAATGREQFRGAIFRHTARCRSASEPVTSKSWLQVSNGGVSRILTKTRHLLVTRAARNRAQALAITYRAASGRERSRGAVFQHTASRRSASEPVTSELWLQVSNYGLAGYRQRAA